MRRFLGEYSEDEFYEFVEDGMEQAIDRVASHSEWAACKRAIARWIEKIDGEYDQIARNEEHGIEP